MIKIIISQRITKIKEYKENRDSLDERFFNLIDQINATYFPIPNSKNIKNINFFLSTIKPNLIILSGGENINTNHKRNYLEKNLLEYSIKKNIKLLGICRGMQFINQYFGGTLKKVKNHVKTFHRINNYSTKYNFPTTVNSYHNYSIKKPGGDLNKIADTFADNEIEAFISKNEMIMGVMWHPERNNKLATEAKWLSKFINTKSK